MLISRLSTHKGHAREEVEQAWEEEIQRRIRHIQEGKAVGIPYNQMNDYLDRILG